MISHFMQNVNNISNYSQNCALKIYEHYKKILFEKTVIYIDKAIFQPKISAAG